MADKSNTEREFTYHVGWKKGKIHCPGQEDLENGQQAPFFYKWKEQWRFFTERFLWRDAPYPSESVVRKLVYALPAAAFIASVWLAYVLSGV